MKSLFRLFGTGFAMGSADIVPGVSGGTMAFILGVYEELIFSIKKITGETLQLILKGKIKRAIRSVPFSFLVPLGLGILTAIVVLSGFLSHQLEENPLYVWSFFFGLIVASIVIVSKRVKTWDTHDIIAAIFGAFIAYILVGIVPVETPANIFAFFLAGMIAIMAMILPGVSGSFLLVLMGKYEQILHAVVERDLVTIGAVGVGAIVGLAVFSRFLSWLFSKHHDIAVSVLTGFMVGSLRKIWPWKQSGFNVIPMFNQDIILPIILMIIAASFMIYMDRKSVTTEHTEDIESKKFKKQHKKAVASQTSNKL